LNTNRDVPLTFTCWLEISPTFGEDSDEEVTSFIDKIIIVQSQGRLHEDTWKNIKQHLNDMKEEQDITFSKLLSNLNIT